MPKVSSSSIGGFSPCDAKISWIVSPNVIRELLKCSLAHKSRCPCGAACTSRLRSNTQSLSTSVRPHPYRNKKNRSVRHKFLSLPTCSASEHFFNSAISFGYWFRDLSMLMVDCGIDTGASVMSYHVGHLGPTWRLRLWLALPEPVRSMLPFPRWAHSAHFPACASDRR